MRRVLKACAMGVVVCASLVARAAYAGDLAPLAGQWLEPLGEGKAQLGFVSPPTGARERRPIVIGVHGAGDRPDWACSEWRAIFGPVPFIVCPQGAPLGPGTKPTSYAWSSRAHVERAIAAAIDAARARYPDHLAVDLPRVYAGFSQGARVGAEVVAASPKLYPHAVFLEGLGDVRGLSFTRGFREGGRRIVLACSQAGCATARHAAARALTKVNIEARVVDAGPIGHVVDGRVIAALRAEVPWLLADEPIWASTLEAIRPAR